MGINSYRKEFALRARGANSFFKEKSPFGMISSLKKANRTLQSTQNIQYYNILRGNIFYNILIWLVGWFWFNGPFR